MSDTPNSKSTHLPKALRLVLCAGLLLSLATTATAQTRATADEEALNSLLAKTAEAPQIQLRDSKAAAAATKPGNAATAAKTSRDPKAMAGVFFEQLSGAKVEEAFATLTSGSNLAKREKDLVLFRERTRQVIDDYGQLAGYELLEEKQAGANLLRLTYVSLAERYPLRWRLYFYKARDEWEIIDMRVDDNLKALFQEEAPAGRQGLASSPLDRGPE